MPSVNVRLSESQHADLVKEKKRTGLSLQAVIIARLFREPLGPPAPSSLDAVSPGKLEDVQVGKVQRPTEFKL